jgi:uncharacterized protein (DUF1697 family)
MHKKIAILRGINVGGKRKILMTDLKSLCENLGWKHVESYIQSGNLIFDSNLENSELECRLEKAIADQFGFDVPVIVRTAEELEDSIRNNPFFVKSADISQLHLTFLKSHPTDEHLKKIKGFSVEADSFAIINKDVFVFCEGKYHQSKLTNNFFEKKLGTGASSRSWKTVLKLKELVEAMNIR